MVTGRGYRAGLVDNPQIYRELLILKNLKIMFYIILTFFNKKTIKNVLFSSILLPVVNVMLMVVGVIVWIIENNFSVTSYHVTILCYHTVSILYTMYVSSYYGYLR